jgi:hypothetical protein
MKNYVKCKGLKIEIAKKREINSENREEICSPL